MIDWDACLRLVKEFEGFYGHVYLDPVGVPTIGYGETRGDIIDAYRGRTMSEPEAAELLRRRLADDYYAPAQEGLPEFNPNQGAAIASFAYNVGVGGWRGSTACKRYVAGDLEGCADALLLWDKAGGRTLPGLTRRRRAEAALFLADRPPNPPQPPTPDPWEALFVPVLIGG